ncbi:type VII secretion protein EccB [Catenulispora yoronensis]
MPGDAHYVVADSGVKYPVPDTTALDHLGYHGVAVVEVPQTLLALLPTGPALDPAAAAGRCRALHRPRTRVPGVERFRGARGKFAQRPGADSLDLPARCEEVNFLWTLVCDQTKTCGVGLSVCS